MVGKRHGIELDDGRHWSRRRARVLQHEHGLVDDLEVPPRGRGHLIEVARHHGHVHDRQKGSERHDEDQRQLVAIDGAGGHEAGAGEEHRQEAQGHAGLCRPAHGPTKRA